MLLASYFLFFSRDHFSFLHYSHPFSSVLWFDAPSPRHHTHLCVWIGMSISIVMICFVVNMILIINNKIVKVSCFEEKSTLKFSQFFFILQKMWILITNEVWVCLLPLHCGVFNNNDFHRLIYLTAWNQEGTLFERIRQIRRCGLVEEVYHWG